MTFTSTISPTPTALTCVHSTPGRLRLRFPERRRDERFARQMERIITPMPGVTQVRANPLTGSVLIHYDLQRTDGGQILTELRRIDLAGGRSPALPLPKRPLAEVAVRFGAAIGKEVAMAMLTAAVGDAWFAPLLTVL